MIGVRIPDQHTYRRLALDFQHTLLAFHLYYNNQYSQSYCDLLRLLVNVVFVFLRQMLVHHGILKQLKNNSNA